MLKEDFLSWGERKVAEVIEDEETRKLDNSLKKNIK